MWDWIKGYSLIDIQDEGRHDFPHLDFQIEKIAAADTTGGMTALGQYFVAAGIWLAENVMIEIPVHDEETRRLILEQIAPHFAQVQRVTQAHEAETIRLQHLRPESKDLFHRTKTAVLPILEDIYRQPGAQEEQREGRRTLLYYTVESGKLEPYPSEAWQELKDVKELLTRAYLHPGGQFGILPSGWTLNAALSHSIALRFFGSFIPAITVCVDADTTEIVMLQFTNQPIKHPVLIAREEFGQTRRVDSFLYYYLSGGLVYVIDLQDQPPIEHWAELESCTLFRMGAGIRFSQFDHASGEQVREGLSLIFDPDTLRTIIQTVNQFCSQGS